ncbi:hypothetical protein [Flexivirga caeni]|nr:hypothetical protein [Flexivirga caeni]
MPPEHISVLGSVIAVDLPEDDRDRVRAQWDRCMAPSDSTALSSVTYSTDDDADRRDYSLASSLTLAGIQHAAGTRLMLHAAGAADPETGRVAVLVAASGTGKTTAAHRLCRAGFGYVTDETVSIGEDDGILPYPKPLSVVIDGDAPHHKSQHGPAELGLAPCPPDPRAALYVVLDRDRDGTGGSEPTLERLPLMDGLIALIPQTSALPSMRRPLQALAGSVHRAGGVWRLAYQEIADTIPLLRDALRSHDPDPTDLVGVAPPEPGCEPGLPAVPVTALDEPEPLDANTLVVRAPYLDAVAIDDELLVLVDCRPARLSGLGATIWPAAGEPVSLAELTRLCVAAHGDHPEADRLVHEAAEELFRHQVLQRA